MLNKLSFRHNYKLFITIFIIGLFVFSSLIAIGYSALNRDIQIAGDIDYTKYEVWAENLSYDTSVTHINCDTAQCMLDCIADESLCP